MRKSKISHEENSLGTKFNYMGLLICYFQQGTAAMMRTVVQTQHNAARELKEGVPVVVYQGMYAYARL